MISPVGYNSISSGIIMHNAFPVYIQCLNTVWSLGLYKKQFHEYHMFVLLFLSPLEKLGDYIFYSAIVF